MVESTTRKDFDVRCTAVGVPAAYGEFTENIHWGDGMARTIPEHMQYDVAVYVLFGRNPDSGFLSSVIEGDLFAAVQNADCVNINALPAYVSFFHNFAPAGCAGSEQRMEDWTKLKWRA